MNSPLPPDPYKTLGVSKDASIAEIRSAHRKLVIKCHPDKVQDEALKAIKQEEFHQVQQAYELLSDDNKRLKYDEQVKLFELKKELGRTGPSHTSTSSRPPPPFPSGTNVFDYEVRTAEPRASTFKPKPKEPTNIYTQPSPRSYGDDIGSGIYDEPPRATARKTASYEERRRASTKEDDKRRKSEEEREHERWEKAAKKTAHGAAKKTRDKERKKGSEEKYSRMAYVDDDSEEYRPSKSEKKSSRRKEEERPRDEFVRSPEKPRVEELPSERTRRFNEKLADATLYMEARRKAVDDDFRPKPMRRAETFQESSFSTRFVPSPSVPYVAVDDDDYPQRSSARPPRRASEQTPTRSRETGRRSYSPEPYIVEAAPPSSRKPSLQTHTSAPPNIDGLRERPHRSKTMQAEYSKKESTPPPLPRAATFQSGDKKSSSRGSRLKQKVEYSDGSDSDSPVYASPRGGSPPPRRRPDPETSRYVINNGRAVPAPSRHRTVLRDDDYSDPRDRSESPRGTRRTGGGDRPPLSRSGGSSSARPSSSSSRPYYPGSLSPDPRGEPIVIPVRPKPSSRGSGGRSSTSQSPYFGEVKFAPSYRPEDVSYSMGGTPEGHYRRGSDPTNHHRDYAAYPVPGPRPAREATYA